MLRRLGGRRLLSLDAGRELCRGGLVRTFRCVSVLGNGKWIDGEGGRGSTRYQPVVARLDGIMPWELRTMRNFGLDILFLGSLY